jgi:hypothetical protein
MSALDAVDGSAAGTCRSRGLGVSMPNAVLEEKHTLHVRLAVKGSVWDWISTQPQIFYYFAKNLNKQGDCSFK